MWRNFRVTVLGLAAACALTAHAAPQEPEFSLAQKEKAGTIETPRELVNIESGSRDREGLDKLAEYLRGRLATSGIGAALITVRGKLAHAGVAPALGRNALIELSHQLVQTRDLSDPAKQIKFNWTMSSAGTTRNVIPDAATATAAAAADVRVQRVADYDTIEKSFLNRIGKNPLVPDTRVEASFERRRPPLEVSHASRALAKKAQAIYSELGRKLDYDESGRGGGTDAAFAALSGKPAVVESFGLAGFNYHSSDDEYVERDSIEPRLYLLTRMIMDAARGR